MAQLESQPQENYSTIKVAYMDVLTELLKEESPTLYVEDFLYYYNKAVSEYVKTRYEIFEITQQLTDDLRFFKKEYIHQGVDGTIIDINDIKPFYRHLLSCVVDIKITRPVVKCNQLPKTTKGYKCKRLTSDVKSAILDNIYLAPTFFRPYFDILDNKIFISVGDITDNSIILSSITIEYLKQPKRYTLTAAQIASNTDTSGVLEYSNDIGEEITKTALKFILERGSDQRLQTHIGVNKSINDPSIQR